MERGYKITTQGRAVLAACMALQKPPVITRAAVGSGLIGEDEDLADRRELIHYVSEASIAGRRHEGDRLFLTVQYASIENKEQPAFVLSEFMVFCLDPVSGQEVSLLYGTLGDYRQPVPAYGEGLPQSVWNYPIVMTASSDLEIFVSASPGLATFEDLLSVKEEIFRAIIMNELTLPLETDSGETLLTDDGTPILADFHPDRSASVLEAVWALNGRLAGQIAAAEAEAINAAGIDAAAKVKTSEDNLTAKIGEAKAEAVRDAGTAAEAKLAAHDASEASHPTYLIADIKS